MADTQYRSLVQVTRANQKAAFRAIDIFFEHCDTWGIGIVQITRPTTGGTAGFIVVTVDNPIPTDNIAHLQLVGPI